MTSLVPFTTQLGTPSSTQSSQRPPKIILIYPDKITERQSSLMKEALIQLRDGLDPCIVQTSGLHSLPATIKYFVVPAPIEDLLKKLRERFDKPAIYVPRAIIEARCHWHITLPPRNRTILLSFTMFRCRVFLLQRCDVAEIRDKILQMGGVLAKTFHDSGINVVITDRADDHYCDKAFELNIPVVSRDWVDRSYEIAKEEDESAFTYDAMKTRGEYLIKPFYGLYFKLNVPQPVSKLKQLITENQGNIVYGDENRLTHIVTLKQHDLRNDHNQKQGPKYIDIKRLELCVDAGYYVRKLSRYQQTQSTAKKTHLTTSMQHPNQMPAPTIIHQPLQQALRKQPQKIQDMIEIALATFESAQTQLASTQMRRLPDQELRIEQTYEPSQQLFWKEN